MPDKRLPIRRAVILRRVDPELRMARFYSLLIERDLFGEVRLVRAWGRLGTQGSELRSPMCPSGWPKAAAFLRRVSAIASPPCGAWPTFSSRISRLFQPISALCGRD